VLLTVGRLDDIARFEFDDVLAAYLKLGLGLR